MLHVKAPAVLWRLLPTGEIPRFVAGLVLWAPLCMALWWFFLKVPLTLALNGFVGPLAEWLMPGWIVSAEPVEGALRLYTSLRRLDAPHILTVLPFTVGGRLTLAFAIFWALTLATPGSRPGERLLNLAWGSVAFVLPLVLAMALMLIGFRLAFAINHLPMLTEEPPSFYLLALPLPGWQMHLIGIGRQLGLLVLPVLAPVLAWGMVHAAFLRRLAGIAAQRVPEAAERPA